VAVSDRLSILVPFRDPDGTRTRAMEWIVARWRYYHPDAEVVFGSDDGFDPFSKSMAVNDAASRATGDVLAILDADTWVEPGPVRQAIAMVRSGEASWVIPARRSYRLSEGFTETLYGSIRPEDPFPEVKILRDTHRVGYVVGFLHILPRAGFDATRGMDPRFRGWGGEDGAFTHAVDTLWGPHVKLDNSVFHVYHEEPRDLRGRRTWLGQVERVANGPLWARYRAAKGRRVMMQIITQEWSQEDLRPPLAAQGGVARRAPAVYSDLVHEASRGSTHMFRNLRYPALRFYAGGKSFKFVGSRLDPAPADLPAVREYAARRPDMGIVEVGVEPVQAEAIAPEPDDASGSLDDLSYSEVKQLAKESGIKTFGVGKDDLVAALRGDTIADAPSS
jgi:hypothetical protein